MGRIIKPLLENLRQFGHSLLTDSEHEKRWKKIHTFLTHPELGPFRAAYIKFFADRIGKREGALDVVDERRFTEQLKRRHPAAIGIQIDTALNDLIANEYIGERVVNRYPILRAHIENLHLADQVRMQIENAKKKS